MVGLPLGTAVPSRSEGSATDRSTSVRRFGVVARSSLCWVRSTLLVRSPPGHRLPSRRLFRGTRSPRGLRAGGEDDDDEDVGRGGWNDDGHGLSPAAGAAAVYAAELRQRVLFFERAVPRRRLELGVRYQRSRVRRVQCESDVPDERVRLDGDGRWLGWRHRWRNGGWHRGRNGGRHRGRNGGRHRRWNGGRHRGRNGGRHRGRHRGRNGGRHRG